MTAKVTRLPGVLCRFRLMGRCAYDEMLNPGLHDAWRCPEEQRLLGYYDGFIERVDVFDLPPEEVAALWSRRMERFPPVGALCGRYEARGDEGGEDAENGDLSATEDAMHDVLVDCIRFRDGICLLLLPPCEGVCERYRRAETPAGGRNG